MVKCASSIDCRGCTRGFTPSLFSAHISICKMIERSGLSVKVIELVKVASERNSAHYEYKMLVNYSGIAWFIFKRFKQFF
jgi:hypothetical protein